MPPVDAHLRVHHPCPYCDLSVEFPRTTLLLWCDNRRDVFLVAAPDARELREVLRALRSSFHGRVLVEEGSDALVVVPDFEWTDPPSVTGLARRGGVWVVHPVVYHEGRETYRLLAPSRSRLHRLVARVRRLGEVELLSVTDRHGLDTVRDLPAASVHFFEGLTEQQVRSLLAAHAGGLFDVPSRGSWGDTARRLGLSRSTFGEHLRKAQRRLLTNSLPFLKPRLRPRPEPEVLPALRASRRVRRTPLQGVRSDPPPDRTP